MQIQNTLTDANHAKYPGSKQPQYE